MASGGYGKEHHMALKCAACGSGHTNAQLDTFCCLDCGALTDFVGTLVRPAKTYGEAGNNEGPPVDATTTEDLSKAKKGKAA
jgi:hypothetical protein